MVKKFLTFVLLLLALSTQIAVSEDSSELTDSGRSAAIVHFISAIKDLDDGETPGAVADSLIHSVNSDRKNSKLPVAYLCSLLKDPEVADKAYPLLSGLAKEFPRSLFYLDAALQAGVAAGIGSREIDKIFPEIDILLAPNTNSNEEKYRKNLFFAYAENLIKIPDHERFRQLAEKVARNEEFSSDIYWQKLLFRNLHCQYMRALAAGKSVGNLPEEMRNAASKLVETAAASENNTENICNAFRYLEAVEFIFPELFDSIEKVLPPELFRTIQLSYISLFGSVEDMAAAIELDYADKTPSSDAIFIYYNAIANGDIKRARKAVESIADKQMQQRFRCMYAIATGDFKFANISGIRNLNDQSDIFNFLSCSNSPELILEVAGAIRKESWEDPAWTNNIGYSLAITGGDLKQAETLVRYSLKRDPDSSDYCDSMALILFKSGKYPEAKKMISRALQTLDNRQSCKTLLDHAGDIESALGNQDMALVYYRRALKCTSRLTPFWGETAKIIEKIKKLESAGYGK